MHLVNLLLLPVICSVGYWIASSITVLLFFRRRKFIAIKSFPFISLIKPVCGLEKNIYENLRSACLQDYPNYEVIYAVQSAFDPALPILKKIQAEFLKPKITIVVDEQMVGSNGRLANIHNAAARATGEIFVFSDSDCFLTPDYLHNITGPLCDPHIGVSCTVYRACRADTIPEALELLSLNTDFVPSLIFAYGVKITVACPGASQAIRREVLEKIGGLHQFADHLVEDFELGRKVRQAGLQIQFVPHVVPITVGLDRWQDWWRHQVYWDQNTKAASPSGFFFTILVRGLPFAILYWLFGGANAGAVLTITLITRWLTSFGNAMLLKDGDGLKALWLLPVRDLLSLFVWMASWMKRKTIWRGRTFEIRRGKMIEVP